MEQETMNTTSYFSSIIPFTRQEGGRKKIPDFSESGGRWGIQGEGEADTEGEGGKVHKPEF